MRLLGVDFETTGFDTAEDRITEIGAVLWDVERKLPLFTHGLYLWDSGIEKKCTPEVCQMMERVCGIRRETLEEFGIDPASALRGLGGICEKHQVEYIVAHNGENFDKPMLTSELSRHGVSSSRIASLPWLDTRFDIPFAEEPDSRKLKHLALDCGFINPFAHRAVFDVLTMMRVLSNYNLEDVIAYSRVPWITVRALVNYDDRQKAKEQRYSWEKIGDKTFPKFWVKRIKENQLAQEQEKCSFKIVRIE